MNYRGFSAVRSTFIAYNEYSLSTLDPAKDQLSGIDTWKKMFDNYIRFYQIPNNPIAANITEEQNIFKKGKVAMHADIYSPYLDLSMLKNWDMVSIPVMNGAPKKIGIFQPGYLLITKQSKHKEEAFQVIMEMLSDEVQMKDARNGFLPTIANKEMTNVLGQDSAILKSKNMKAVGYYEFAAPRPSRQKGMTVVDTRTADKLLENAFIDAALGIPWTFASFRSKPFYEQHPEWTTVGKNIVDHMQGVDLLCSLDRVNAERIGVIGLSFGGYNSYFLAGLDDRIRASVNICGFSPFYGDPRPTHWGVRDWYTHLPKITAYLSRNEVPFEFHEIAALAAPIPSFHCFAQGDKIFPHWQAIGECMVELHELYRFLGSEDRFQAVMTTGGHDFPADIRVMAFAFLDRWLMENNTR